LLAKRRRGVASASQALTRVHHETADSLMSGQMASLQDAATMADNDLATLRQHLLEPRRLPASGACLVAGCPCKDPRIVSHRRAAFFAAVARDHGETPNRAVPVDLEWQLPTRTF
jgi:hypothetical protein